MMMVMIAVRIVLMLLSKSGNDQFETKAGGETVVTYTGSLRRSRWMPLYYSQWMAGGAYF
jgi:hypothetical protein